MDEEDLKRLEELLDAAEPVVELVLIVAAGLLLLAVLL